MQKWIIGRSDSSEISKCAVGGTWFKMEHEKEQEFFQKDKWYAESRNLKALKILMRKEMAKNQRSQIYTPETSKYTNTR